MRKIIPIIIIGVVIGIIVLGYLEYKSGQKKSKERLESRIDIRIIESFLNEFGNEYSNYQYLVAWNFFYEKKGRYVTTWKYLYLILFNESENYFDMLNIKFTGEKILYLSDRRIFLEKNRVKYIEKNENDCGLEVLNSKELFNLKGNIRFVLKKIPDGWGEKEQLNPFAIDQSKEYESFLRFLKV